MLWVKSIDLFIEMLAIQNGFRPFSFDSPKEKGLAKKKIRFKEERDLLLKYPPLVVPPSSEGYCSFWVEQPNRNGMRSKLSLNTALTAGKAAVRFILLNRRVPKNFTLTSPTPPQTIGGQPYMKCKVRPSMVSVWSLSPKASVRAGWGLGEGRQSISKWYFLFVRLFLLII